jgi:hypothetical protein
MDRSGEVKAEGGAELRASRRTNLMLAATIEIGGRSAAVRIRNLSDTGALLDGGGLPAEGTAIVVRRGDLEIASVVAWSSGDRCGVRFEQPIPVNDWTGGKPRPLECTGLRDQRRVDAIQAEFRAATAPTPSAASLVSPQTDSAPIEQLDSRLADELAYVQRLLESLGDELITEPVVVRNHARALQSIDIAGQILAHLARILVADDRPAAVEDIGMSDLRARLKRKPLV